MNFFQQFKFLPLLILSILLPAEACSQRQLVGQCEGCEAVFEYGNRTITSVDTLPEFDTPGTKIKVSGTVYKPDGVTPAPDVILYLYQTNEEGVYPTTGNEEGWGRRHGYIRGWVKTDQQGEYTFYSQMPGMYGSEPAHIHITVLEPNGKYYWLVSYHFEGDPRLTPAEINDPDPRGGSTGILELKEDGNILAGTRDIILGRNIPGY